MNKQKILLRLDMKIIDLDKDLNFSDPKTAQHQKILAERNKTFRLAQRVRFSKNYRPCYYD